MPIEDAPGIAQAFAKIRERSDLVFVDQRGTGGSHPLNCELFDPADAKRQNAGGRRQNAGNRRQKINGRDLRLSTLISSDPALSGRRQ